MRALCNQAKRNKSEKFHAVMAADNSKKFNERMGLCEAMDI